VNGYRIFPGQIRILAAIGGCGRVIARNYVRAMGIEPTTTAEVAPDTP
jgi:hypothetical protein